MDDDRLFEVRCPAKVLDKKQGKLITCNKLCVKVFPGSSGEVQCRNCKMRFRFYIDDQAQSRLAVRVQPVPKLDK